MSQSIIISTASSQQMFKAIPSERILIIPQNSCYNNYFFIISLYYRKNSLYNFPYRCKRNYSLQQMYREEFILEKERFGKHISLIYRYSQIYFNEKLKKYNLGSGQYIFLLSLLDNNGINQEELSQIIKVDKTTTARAVAKLVKENYIIRRKDEHDKRAYNLYPTAKAESMRNILANILDGWNNILLSSLADEERKTLLHLISKVGANVLEKASPAEENLPPGEKNTL